MRLLKILVVVSLIGIALIEARGYLAVPPPPPRPWHAPRFPRLGRRIAERIVAPIAARADRGGHLRWR